MDITTEMVSLTTLDPEDGQLMISKETDAYSIPTLIATKVQLGNESESDLFTDIYYDVLIDLYDAAIAEIENDNIIFDDEEEASQRENEDDEMYQQRIADKKSELLDYYNAEKDRIEEKYNIYETELEEEFKEYEW